MTSEFARDLEHLYTTLGTRRYGLDSISQLQHALQAAQAAENNDEPPSMVVAALLHDVGHMVGALGENPAGDGIDNRHEVIGADWLMSRFGADIAEVVRLHVPAKRYLCTTDATYMAALAPDSVLSLKLQGGPMTRVEAAHFETLPYAGDAVRLRRYDEAAKDPDAVTPTFAHFLKYLPTSA